MVLLVGVEYNSLLHSLCVETEKRTTFVQGVRGDDTRNGSVAVAMAWQQQTGQSLYNFFLC